MRILGFFNISHQTETFYGSTKEERKGERRTEKEKREEAIMR
jgi:hypothetical protein